MIKRILIIFLLLCSNAYAQQGSTSPTFGRDKCIWFETEDGTVKNLGCFKIKVTDGSLTNNGDGTFSLSAGGGTSYISCWESNGVGGIMPVTGSCGDAQWEDNGAGGIMPKT